MKRKSKPRAAGFSRINRLAGRFCRTEMVEEMRQIGKPQAGTKMAPCGDSLPHDDYLCSPVLHRPKQQA